MKGAKGGKRDQIISKKFHEMIEEALKKQNIGETTNSDVKPTSSENTVLIKEPKEKTLETETISNSPLATSEEKEQADEIKDNIKKEVERVEIIEQKEEQKRKVQEGIIINKLKTRQKEQLEEKENEQILEEYQIEEAKETPKEQMSKSYEKEQEDIYIEKLLLNELEKTIQQDYYELKDLEYRIDIISIKEDQAVTKEEIEQLQMELEGLLIKFDFLKNKYIKGDITNIYDGDDKEQLSKLIQEYKLGIKKNEEISELIKRIEEAKERISIIETIIVTEQKKEDVEEELDDRYDEFKIRDEKFNVIENQVNNVDEINRNIQKLSNNLENELKSLEEYLKNNTKIYSNIERNTKTIHHISRILEATSMIAASTLIPRTPIGNIIKASLVAAAINNLAHVRETKEEVSIKKTITYTDYSADIRNNSYTLENIAGEIDNALSNIKMLRETIKDELGEYITQIPEYADLISDLDKIEDELIKQQNNINNYKIKIENQDKTNKEKIYIKEYELKEN